MKTDTPRPIRLKDYTPSSHLIDKVDLTFKLDPTETLVTSRLSLRPNPAAKKSDGRLRLDGVDLELKSIKCDGRVVADDAYIAAADSLSLTGLPDKPFKLEIVTQINPSANTALQGLYLSNGIFCTQCEAEGFRRITYMLDRPDVLAVYSCRIEADVDAAPVLLSNGNPKERGTLDGGKRHYAIWKDPHPKPSYLFALVGGNLTSIASDFTTMDGEKVDLRIYCEPGREDRCVWAMDALKRSMTWDEVRFGRAYDLEVFNIVAVADFNMGAMENKGLNVFNDRLILASPESASDFIYIAIESVVAHEYFHNWTGNRITCRDWFQLCLKEGLTVYRDQEFSSDERSRGVQRIGDVRGLRAHQFPEDAGPLAHPVRPSSYIEINNFYTATVYEKGAELVRMIATIVGEAGFRAGMDLYFERHDGDAATIEDFIACFEEATGTSLKQFSHWYHQAGTPEVVCKLAHDRAKKTAELTCEQILPETPQKTKPKPLHIPLAMAMFDPDGAELDLSDGAPKGFADGVLHLTKAKQTFKFKHIEKRPLLSMLRGFSAPVKLTLPTSERQLAFLMEHETDPFARWEASNDFATRLLIALTRKGDNDAVRERIAIFADAQATIVADKDLETAYRAEILRLPSEADIARELQRNVDPDAIHEARDTMMQQLGKLNGRVLKGLYDTLATDEAYAPTPEQVGRRSLRNIALVYLTARGGAADRKRVKAHFETASNMTDQALALTILAHGTGKARTEALDAFYEQWQDDQLVLQTWFAVQATSAASGTPARMRTLMKHPAYNATTPNTIRAVVGQFAMGNPVQFNRADGEGYRFVADQVLAIDKVNPQVAARICGSFRSWRALEAGRRKLAKAAIKSLAQSDGLSRDVYEIATKILD